MKTMHALHLVAPLTLALSCASTKSEPPPGQEPAPKGAEPNAEPNAGPTDPSALFLLSVPMAKGRCVFVVPHAERTRMSSLAMKVMKEEVETIPAELGPCLSTAAELEKHEPSLPGRVKPSNLAVAIHALRNPDPALESRVFSGKLIFDFATLLSPFDLSQHTVWRRKSVHQGPDPQDLRPPTLSDDEKTLTYDQMTRTRFDVTEHVLVVEAQRVAVDLAAPGWPARSQPLPQTDYEKPRIAEADAAFGGPVEGIVTIPAGKENWYLAIKPTGGAAQHVWGSASGSKVAFEDVASLEQKHPWAATAEGRGAAARILAKHFVEYGFKVIEDADAWKREYREKGYRTRYNPRYHEGTTYQDPVVYTVADFDAIASPTWQGQTLIVYLAGERNQQPYRARLDLTALAIGTRLKPEFLATFEQLTDPKDPEAGPGPTPIKRQP